MIKYDVVMHPDLNGLVKAVNAKIKEGWKPLGGICLSRSKFSVQISEDTRYCQAVVKEIVQ